MRAATQVQRLQLVQGTDVAHCIAGVRAVSQAETREARQAWLCFVSCTLPCAAAIHKLEHLRLQRRWCMIRCPDTHSTPLMQRYRIVILMKSDMPQAESARQRGYPSIAPVIGIHAVAISSPDCTVATLSKSGSLKHIQWTVKKSFCKKSVVLAGWASRKGKVWYL